MNHREKAPEKNKSSTWGVGIGQKPHAVLEAGKDFKSKVSSERDHAGGPWAQRKEERDRQPDREIQRLTHNVLSALQGCRGRTGSDETRQET